jgi:hypothetical protein
MIIQRHHIGDTLTIRLRLKQTVRNVVINDRFWSLPSSSYLSFNTPLNPFLPVLSKFRVMEPSLQDLYLPSGELDGKASILINFVGVTLIVGITLFSRTLVVGFVAILLNLQLFKSPFKFALIFMFRDSMLSLSW